MKLSRRECRVVVYDAVETCLTIDKLSLLMYNWTSGASGRFYPNIVEYYYECMILLIIQSEKVYRELIKIFNNNKKITKQNKK